VGICTRWLAGEYPEAAVTGIDLSPHMLAVAELRERQWEEAREQARSAAPATPPPAAVGADAAPGAQLRRRIRYLHGMLERSRLPPASLDLVAVQFLIHECPAAIISQQARRRSARKEAPELPCEAPREKRPPPLPETLS
jgi:SAM-dependent methyltransferase